MKLPSCSPLLAQCQLTDSFSFSVPPMLSADDVEKEMQALAGLIQTRRKTFPEEEKGLCSAQEKSMVESLAHKVRSSLRCTLQEAQQIYAAVADSGLDSSLRDILRNSIDKAMSSRTVAMPQQGFKPQKLQHLQNYLVQEEWNILQSHETSWIAKCNCICKRWRLLGIRSLHEQTCKNACALLLCQLSKAPDSTVCKQMLDDLKSTFHSLPASAFLDRPYVQEFPEHPSSLPDELFKAAYESRSPVAKQFESMQALSRLIPLRKTNKFLNSTAGEQKGQQTKATPPAAPGGSSSNQHNHNDFHSMPMMMNAMANLVQTFAGHNSNAKASEPGLANLKVSPAKQKAIADGSVQATAASFKPKNRELCAGEKPEASNQAELPEGIGKDNDLSAKIAVDYEQELFDALKAKNEKKRAHDETSNGPAKVMKRPAGKPKATSKAKAKEKKEELDGYEIPPLSKEDLALKRNVYVSRA